jgi:hypothetical protein
MKMDLIMKNSRKNKKILWPILRFNNYVTIFNDRSGRENLGRAFKRQSQQYSEWLGRAFKRRSQQYSTGTDNYTQCRMTMTSAKLRIEMVEKVRVNSPMYFCWDLAKPRTISVSLTGHNHRSMEHVTDILNCLVNTRSKGNGHIVSA